MSRDAPPLLGRLPAQFFTGVLARTAAAAAQDGPRVLDLGRGNPDLGPPAAATDAVASAASGYAGYPPFQGADGLREAFCARYLADHGVALDPDREVAVVPGTKTGISLVCLAAAGPGDVVLLPDPGYPDYPSGVAMAGATAAPLPLDPSAGWQPDWDAVPDDDRVALALLNYPSNPTAAAAAPGTFERAVAEAARRGCWLVHDLAYGGIAFDGRRTPSVLEADGAREVAAELWSASKTYGVAGWRLGFLAGSAELVARVRTLLDHLHAGVWTGLQAGLEAALRGDQADVAARRATYQARRDRLLAGLRGAGAELATPEGTFYAWWRPPGWVTPDVLLQRARVSVAPGEGFGARGAGWVRLSLALPDADLDEAVARVARVLGEGPA